MIQEPYLYYRNKCGETTIISSKNDKSRCAEKQLDDFIAFPVSITKCLFQEAADK